MQCLADDNVLSYSLEDSWFTYYFYFRTLFIRVMSSRTGKHAEKVTA